MQITMASAPHQIFAHHHFRNLFLAVTILLLLPGFRLVAAADPVPAGNSDAFYAKYPHLEDYFPYFPYTSANPAEPRARHMFERWNECNFNTIVNYDFFMMIADMPYSAETSWYVEKSLGITPFGKAYFAWIREHRLKLFGHVQIWLGQYTKLNPMHKYFIGPERDLTAAEITEAEGLLKKQLTYFASLSRGELNDIMPIWVTDDEPNNVGATKAVHQLMAKYDPSKPVINIDPTMAACQAMVPHLEIQGGDLYVLGDFYRLQWDMQANFEKLYRLNPKAITMLVADATAWSIHEPTKEFLRDGRPDTAEMRNQVWQALAGGAKGIGYWSVSMPPTPYAYSNSVLDYYYQPDKMKTFDVISELGRSLTTIGPLLLHTHPDLETRPVIGCGTVRYSTYAGPSMRGGLLRHNTADEQYLVFYSNSLDIPVSGVIQPLPDWAGKKVYNLRTLTEVLPTSATPAYPTGTLAAGDGNVFLIGSPAAFERCRNTVLKHQARMLLPLVENRLRLARAWKNDGTPAEALLKTAATAETAGDFAACLKQREAALAKADEIIRADKDLQWCRDWLPIVTSQLSAISAKVAGNWRPLELDWSKYHQIEMARTNKVAAGPLCLLMELAVRQADLDRQILLGGHDQYLEIQGRMLSLYTACEYLQTVFDRLIADRLAATRKPVKVAFLSAGRDVMDYVVTYSWLYDACATDWIKLDADGVFKNREKKAVNLTDYDVLWFHQVSMAQAAAKPTEPTPAEIFAPAFLKPEVLTAVKAFSAKGKGLLLTGLATAYTVPLGLEPALPDAFHDGGNYQGSFDAGYKPLPGAESHPAFAGLEAGGFYTVANACPYNEVTECTWLKRQPTGRVAASLLDPEVGEIRDYAAMVEYPSVAAGTGLTVALGGTPSDLTPGEHTSIKGNTRDKMLERQRQFLLNLLVYLGGGKPYAYTAAATAVADPRQLTLLPPVWKFKLDPKNEGMSGRWFEPALADAAWADIPVGTSWESCGYDYDGYAWYRVKFKVPETLKGKKILLHFGAVDEQAVVFLDGQEIGRQSVTANWDKPFEFDITSRITDFTRDYQLTVQVLDAAAAGGIWRKVWLQTENKQDDGKD